MAIQFANDGDHIGVPDSLTLFDDSVFTMVGWFNIPSGTGDGFLFMDRGDDFDEQIQIRFRQSNGADFAVWFRTPTALMNLVTSGGWDDGNWHEFIYRRNASSDFEFLIDGTVEASDTTTDPGTLSPTDPTQEIGSNPVDDADTLHAHAARMAAWPGAAVSNADCADFLTTASWSSRPAWWLEGVLPSNPVDFSGNDVGFSTVGPPTRTSHPPAIATPWEFPVETPVADGEGRLIAVPVGGDLHVASDTSHRASADDGATFDAADTIPGGGGGASQYGGLAALVGSPEDRLHILQPQSDSGGSDSLHDHRRSTDGGASWSAAETLQDDTGTNISLRRMQMEVDPATGDVFIMGLKTSTDPDQSWVFRSTDGGQTFDNGVQLQNAGQGIAVDPQSGHVFALTKDPSTGVMTVERSTDRAQSFEAPVEVSDGRTGIRERIAADEGTVCAFWQNQDAGNDRDLECAVSHDAGDNWSGVRTAMDASAIGPLATKLEHYDIWMVGQVVHVCTTSEAASSTPEPTWYARSPDGGLNWTAPEFIGAPAGVLWNVRADRDWVHVTTSDVPGLTQLYVRRSLSDLNYPPDAPTATGATSVGDTTATLNGDTYSDPEGDPHASSDWQVREQGAADWSAGNLVYEVVDSADLESHGATGLPSGTALEYRVRYTDDQGNDSGWSAPSQFTTTSSDTTAPTLSNPTASEDGTDGYSGSVDTDEGNGTLYHVVTQSSTAPTAAEVKAGQDDTGSAADASGNQAVSASGTQNVGQTGVLSSGTQYWIHYMHEDAAGNQSAVASSTSFTTTSTDTTAPTLSNPTGTGTGDTTADGSVDTDEGDGTLHWVVTESSTAPSVAQVQAGQNDGGTAAAASGNQGVSSTGTQSISATGLDPDTTYWIHYQQQDAAGNDSTVVSSSSFSTDSQTTPTSGGLFVDGKDLRDLGLIVQSDLEGWRHSLGRQHQSRGQPGRIGEARLTRTSRAEARRMVVRGYQRAPDLSTLLARRDELLWRLDGAQDIEVKFSDQLDRRFVARLDGPVRIEGIQPSLTAAKHRVEIPLRCEDPRAYETSETQVTVGSADGDVDVPLGTAPVEPTIEVDVASFTLTYKSASGEVLETLEVAGASATPVTVDMEAQTITSSNGSEMDALASGWFFSLAPHDGDYPTSTWPTLAVDAGTASVSYRKAFH